jgi:hypothetical protein
MKQAEQEPRLRAPGVLFVDGGYSLATDGAQKHADRAPHRTTAGQPLPGYGPIAHQHSCKRYLMFQGPDFDAKCQNTKK